MAHIELRTGDILKADAEAIVNTVNCVGIMGRGIALQFKKAFPANFRAYALACDEGEVQPGRMFVYDTGAFTNPRYIINFPTKRHWKGKSRIEDIDSGLIALAQEVRARGIRSIAIPPLGAGLGGLDWNDVRPRIEAERLSAIIQSFNDHFGNIDWADGDRIRKLITEEIPQRVAADEAYQSLIHNYRF